MKDIQTLIDGLIYVHNNAHKCFLKSSPSPKTNVEIMFYAQFVMLHLIHSEYPQHLDNISRSIHGNLDRYIEENKLESEFPGQLDEFINSRYQHYQSDFEKQSSNQIMMRFNNIRNIYVEPFIKVSASPANIDFST
jgi:hypothetical protein